jgi:hypothetical protein
MITQSSATELIQLDDKLVRLVLVPVVGIVIPAFTGLYDGMDPRTPLSWLATGYFVLISFVLWQGNRFLWVRLRGRPDWLEHPVLRILLLGTASVSYTMVVCATLVVLWQRIQGLSKPNWHAVQVSTLVTVICVIVIVHSYETVYLIRQRSRDQAEREKLDRARALAEVAALKSQIDPHFLFNSLNTLVGLTEEDPERVTEFTLTLADVYRYVVANRNRELIPLAEEIRFLEKFHSLLRLRFGDGVRLELPALPPHDQHSLVPPVSLQCLLENAVKHNQYSNEKPLRVVIELKPGAIVVWNATRQLTTRAPGAQTGLRDLDARCKLVSGAGIEVRNEGGRFIVVLPLV